jgi:hypothetical protein
VLLPVRLTRSLALCITRGKCAFPAISLGEFESCDIERQSIVAMLGRKIFDSLDSTTVHLHKFHCASIIPLQTLILTEASSNN